MFSLAFPSSDPKVRLANVVGLVKKVFFCFLPARSLVCLLACFGLDTKNVASVVTIFHSVDKDQYHGHSIYLCKF